MAEKKPKQPQPDPHQPDPDQPGPTFEDAMAEVEAIIERIETGRSGLEHSIGEYEKGVRLLARCRGLLKDAQQRIEDVTGKLEAEGSGPQPDSPD